MPSPSWNRCRLLVLLAAGTQRNKAEARSIFDQRVTKIGVAHAANKMEVFCPKLVGFLACPLASGGAYLFCIN